MFLCDAGSAGNDCGWGHRRNRFFTLFYSTGATESLGCLATFHRQASADGK